MSVQAPRSADALRGRLDVTDEARGYLHRVEGEAEELMAEVTARLVGDAADPGLAAAGADLRLFLDGERKSPLRRALERRGTDLEAGGIARRSLDHAWRAVRGRAARAIDRHDAAVELERVLRRVRHRFSERLPWHLEQAMADVGVVDEAVLRTRETAWLGARRSRLEQVEQELAAAEARLPVHVAEPIDVRDWPSGVSPAELAAAVAETERAAGMEAGGGQRETLRALAERHLERLRGPPGGNRQAPALAETAAGESVAVVGAGLAAHGADLDAWGVLLRHAAQKRAPAPPGEQLPLPAPESAAVASTLYVVPLLGPYVLIRTGTGWPVQVKGRSVRSGAPVECVAAIPVGAEAVALEREAWAGPLFDLPADAGGHWLETRTPATVLPFARIAQDRWLARVVERGTLVLGATPAWERLPRRSGPAVRTLPPADAVPADAVLATGTPVRSERSFGWETHTVPLPLADLTHGWLRTAAGGPGRRAVQHEQAFFRALETRSTTRSPRRLGQPAEGWGFLYAPPVAQPVGSSAALRAWREQDPYALVAAAALLWRDLAEMRLGLGLYHPATIGFRVGECRRGSPDALYAVALAAPLGTLLDRPYRAAPSPIPLLERLESVPLHPAQASAGPATRETEAALFAVYALDLLAEHPLGSPAPRTWEEFVGSLSSPRWSFRHPELAAELVRGLGPEAGADLVLMVTELGGRAGV